MGKRSSLLCLLHQRVYGCCFLLLILFLWARPSLAYENEAATGSGAVKRVLQKADAYAESNHLDSAAYWYQQAARLASQNSSKQEEVYAQRGYIRVLDRQGRFKEACQLAEKVLISSMELGKQELSISYNYLGNLNFNLGKLQDAAANYLKALKLAEESGDVKNQMKYSYNLADVFSDLEDLEKHQYYANNCYQLALQHQDSANIGYGLIGIAYTELKKKAYTRATQHFNEVLKIGQAIKNPFHQMIAYANLGEIAYQQQQYQQALSYYMQGMHVLHYYPRVKTELQLYFGMAQAYAQLEMYTAAEYYLQKAITLGKEADAANQLRSMYKEGAVIYEKMQKPALALELRKKYQLLKDSLVSEKNRQNIHRLEIEYQTSQKEKEIAQQSLLLTQNELEIARKDTLIYLFLIFVAALVSVIILLFLAYRGRQRANTDTIHKLQRENDLKILLASLQGEEKERSRLARELHDGVGGILSATKMHLSVLRAQAACTPFQQEMLHTSALLDTACQEVRNIAHHLSAEYLQKHSLEEALARYCRDACTAFLQVEFYSLGEPLQLKPPLRLVYYRIVQELINSIIRHVGATQVLVQLSYHQGLVSITVEENGSGLRAEGAHGQCLLGLKQRIDALGGKLSIDSEVKRGTTIYLEFESDNSLAEAPLTTATA